MDQLTQGQLIIYCTTWALAYHKTGKVDDAISAASRAVDAATKTPSAQTNFANQLERHVHAVTDTK